MANIVLMPQLGISEESAVLSKWSIKTGDKVKVGQLIFTLETGKASFDVESEYDGSVLALLCAEGDEVPIKAPLCVIGQEGETWQLSQPEREAAPAAAASEVAAKQPAAAESAVSRPAEGEAHASPRARALAEKAGISTSGITPTGPEGRIIERDVAAVLNAGRAVKEPEKPQEAPQAQKPVEAAAESKDYFDEPLSPMRKAIARNMHASLSEMAQLTLSVTFDATELLAFRKEAKSGAVPGTEGITLNDMLLFAVSRTVKDFPAVNAHYLGDKIRYFNTVNLGFACDTDKGLLVPVIKGAEKLSLAAISAEAKRLAREAQAGKLPLSEMEGGSITVSNLGSLGVESFTPVINPPQTCILGACTLTTRVRLADGVPQYYQAMGLSLTFDHRAIDGAPAARFLKALCGGLESFKLLLAK